VPNFIRKLAAVALLMMIPLQGLGAASLSVLFFPEQPQRPPFSASVPSR